VVKIVEGEDLDISLFALSKSQQAAVSELEAAIAKIKRLKMSLVAVDDRLFASTRENHLDHYTEGAIVQSSLLASSAQGIIERVRQGEVGIVEIVTKGAVHVAEPLVIESRALDELDSTSDRPLAYAMEIPELRGEIAVRRAKGKPSKPFIRGRRVLFK
jgi:hypothetical protein